MFDRRYKNTHTFFSQTFVSIMCLVLASAVLSFSYIVAKRYLIVDPGVPNTASCSVAFPLLRSALSGSGQVSPHLALPLFHARRLFIVPAAIRLIGFWRKPL